MQHIQFSFALVLILMNACRADNAKLVLEIDPKIQDQINRIYQTVQYDADPQDNVEAFKEVQRLKDSVADKSEVVEQVAIFAAKPGEDKPLMALMIMHLLDLPPQTVIQSLAPYLNAENSNLRSFVLDWFQNHDNGGLKESPLDPLNYKDYRDYVCRRVARNEPIPDAFVEYLFRRSPGHALLIYVDADKTLATIDRLKAMRKDSDRQSSGPDKLPPPKASAGPKEILLSEHLINNAIWLNQKSFAEQFRAVLPGALAELARLAEHREWWARRYVVQIMTQHPYLREPEVLRRLAIDSNPLVAEAAKSIAE